MSETQTKAEHERLTCKRHYSDSQSVKWKIDHVVSYSPPFPTIQLNIHLRSEFAITSYSFINMVLCKRFVPFFLWYMDIDYVYDTYLYVLPRKWEEFVEICKHTWKYSM